ncbi:MucB/RseB C-terminal domain-containing protein [Shewanella schlegeliana]|uniref:MucB/RseB C-terminal domain-containing protein n=1 Tax=Shewanella schlegeliana TaxID=190308 RepID=A0ABS1SUH6_9GAMM|nr:MucB/RseB C-terminal domain-containing protein [Shewanella schlegeliana]MBL4912187.1 MucB/RseB C-terminal domain-containing protein [Shewanella schlegeliana]MCL1110727.1 MucB/RseB C-terminal domain-containing protein [Shewanella schlegeliana]GIU22701.1 sigma-E factor regulatory protein RseB [Shewanella schlegeliana]
MRLILLAIIAMSFPAMAREDMPAKAWLENMSQALREQEFKISLIQLQADHIRPLVYIHGKVNDEEVAFLEHLNGPPKNAVRVGNTVTFIEHDQPAYSVHSNRIQGVIPAAFADDISKLETGYQFVLGGRSRIAGRPGQLVRIIPTDDNRYGYQVWLDMDTYLPLRFDMISGDKQLLEQLLVVELLVLDEVPAILKEAYKQEWPPVLSQSDREGGEDWQFSWLPAGFKVLIKDQHRLIGSKEAVEYIAISDGLANISVYVAKAGEAPLPEELVTRNGLSLATERVGNAEVVAVGKVPAETLSRIAKSIMLQ